MDQEVILNFKANHLCCTFKQLAEKTDGENKQPNRQFWEDNNIMNATHNIRPS
jgi:hypothetical protein